jgi:hypothetical protein
MIEDDYYRASTQYRHWSYTPQQLAEIRQQTNELASGKVRAAFRRARSQRNSTNGDQEGADSMSDDTPINTLTVEEELKIVAWGCGKIIEMGESMKPRVPTHVVVSHRYHLSFALRDRIPDPMTTSPDPSHPSNQPSNITPSGDSDPIPPPLLPHQLPYDLPPQIHPTLLSLPRLQV